MRLRMRPSCRWAWGPPAEGWGRVAGRRGPGGSHAPTLLPWSSAGVSGRSPAGGASRPEPGTEERSSVGDAALHFPGSADGAGHCAPWRRVGLESQAHPAIGFPGAGTVRAYRRAAVRTVLLPPPSGRATALRRAPARSVSAWRPETPEPGRAAPGAGPRTHRTGPAAVLRSGARMAGTRPAAHRMVRVQAMVPAKTVIWISQCVSR
jgi:hypothetical protein